MFKNRSRNSAKCEIAIRYRLLRLLILVPVFFLLSCESASRFSLTAVEQQWLEKNKQDLEVLFGYEAPPNAFYDSTGEYKGLLVDFLYEIENHIGLSLNLKKFDTWKALIEHAKTTKNFVIVGIARTENRERYLSFTDPFVKVPYVLVVRKSSPLSTMQGTTDSKVCTVEGYAVNDYIRRYYPHITPSVTSSNREGLRAVSTGGCDVMVINQMYASYLIEDQGLTNLKIAGESGYLNRLSAAVSIEDPVLFSVLEKAVDSITPARQQELFRKWVDSGEKRLSDTQLLMIAGLLIVFLFCRWFSGADRADSHNK